VGEQVEVVWGGLGRPVPRTTHWPTLVRGAQSGLCPWLGANQGLVFHVPGYTAGMAFLLGVTDSEARSTDSLAIVLFWPLLTSTRAQIPTRSRVRGMIGASLSAHLYHNRANLLMSIAIDRQGIQ
jgi:hypothetical protein